MELDALYSFAIYGIYMVYEMEFVELIKRTSYVNTSQSYNRENGPGC